MKSEKKFLRQCVCCRKMNSKENLIRITRDYKTEELKINQLSEIQGRSVYICKNNECVQNAIKKKKIEHFLRSNMTVQLKEALNAVLKN